MKIRKDFIFDVDGVLTDGTITLFGNGEQVRKMCARDGYAMQYALKKGYKIIDYDTFFYPLDYILNWNKIYGQKGFAQYQCVIPLKNALPGVRELLETISNSNSNSFLAVLKRFGKQEGHLSFPIEGYTLALDFPITKRKNERSKSNL